MRNEREGVFVIICRLLKYQKLFVEEWATMQAVLNMEPSRRVRVVLPATKMFQFIFLTD